MRKLRPHGELLILQVHNLELAPHFWGPFCDATVPTVLQVNSEEWCSLLRLQRSRSWIQGVTQQQGTVETMRLD